MSALPRRPPSLDTKPRPDGLWRGRYWAVDSTGRKVRRDIYAPTKEELEPKIAAAMAAENHSAPALVAATRAHRPRGQGTVTPPAIEGGTWRARGVDQATGKRVSVTGATADEAEQHLLDATGRGNPSVAHWLGKWLELRKPDLDSRSWHRYEESVRLHLIPEFGDEVLLGLRAPRVREGYVHLLAKGMSGGTAKRCHATLHAALQAAMDAGLLAGNPAAGHYTWPAPATVAVRLLEPGDEQRLLGLRDPQLNAACLLALRTGMDLGEILDLRWSRVLVEERAIEVRSKLIRTLEPGDNDSTRYGTQSVPLKAGQARRLQLTTEVLEALQRSRAAQIRRQVPSAPGDLELVVAARSGKPYQSSEMSQRLRERCRSVHIPVYTFQDLRDTAAVTMLRGGAGIQEVSSALGLSSPRYVYDRYESWINERSRT